MALEVMSKPTFPMAMSSAFTTQILGIMHHIRGTEYGFWTTLLLALGFMAVEIQPVNEITFTISGYCNYRSRFCPGDFGAGMD